MGELDELWTTDEDLAVVHPSSATASAANVEALRLRYLVDNTPAIIYASVPTGDFKWTYVSANVWNVLGYRPDAIMADPNFWFDRIHPEDLPQIFSSLARIFVDGERAYEYRFRAADGSYLWMHDSLRLVRDDDGASVEIVGSLTDISDRKAMEEALRRQSDEQRHLISSLREAQAQLVQSEKMASLGQLAAGVAHEINNPIGFVNSNVTSLRDYVSSLLTLVDGMHRAIADCDCSDDVKQHIALLQRKADLDFLRGDVVDLVEESLDGLVRVREIVQSLRNFSRMGESNWDEVDLHVGLESTLHIVNNEIKYKATVRKEYGDLPKVPCIASQVNQVFMNLLVNAAQAIGTRGEIVIRSGADDATAWIEIEDTGSGIEPAHLERIFEPFFTTKPVGSGTGLGLSVSYGIVHRHGGRIDVTSEVGVGTRFRVHLPLHRAKE